MTNDEYRMPNGGVAHSGTVVCSGLWYAEFDPGALSGPMMARALGLWLSFFPHVCASCGDADTEPSKFMELDQGHMGIMTRAVCVACLRVEFLARCGARSVVMAANDDHTRAGAATNEERRVA